MWCSWKSTTTRQRRCGAWTSCSTPVRRPTRRPGRCSKASSFPSRIKGADTMAKMSQINRNKKREKLVALYAVKRAALKARADDMKLPAEERFDARLKLAKLPRNSSKVRIHHRCELSGRPKGYYRKVRLSRIALRSLSNFGQIPGMTKASGEGAT